MDFKVMLATLAREMTARDLETMRFMCSEFIPKAVSEEIDSGLKLWTALEERAKLSPVDTAFLRVLLENCVSKRTDLLGILNEYESQHPAVGGALRPAGVATPTMTTHALLISERTQSAPTHLPPEIQEAFSIISIEVGRNWRNLVRNLGLSESSIDECIERHPGKLREQITMALNLWAATPGLDVSRIELCKALNKSQLKLIAQKLQK